MFWEFQVKPNLASVLSFFLSFLGGCVAIGHNQSTAMLMAENSMQASLGEACYLMDPHGLTRSSGKGTRVLSIVQVGN